jgi:hypothetical protein
MARERKRGGVWDRFDVHFNVALRPRSRFAGLPAQERERAKKTAMLVALESGQPPAWARISRLWWANPEAGYDSRVDPSKYGGPYTEEEAAADYAQHLPSLNLGGWLANSLLYELSKLGGRFEFEPEWAEFEIEIGPKRKQRRKQPRDSKGRFIRRKGVRRRGGKPPVQHHKKARKVAHPRKKVAGIRTRRVKSRPTRTRRRH